MTHIMGHALAHGLGRMPRDVCRISWGYFKHSKRIGVTILCDVEGGQDLVPITLWDAHKMSILEFAAKCNERVNKAKTKQDKTHN